MTAIFGHIGPCSDSLITRMGQTLSHRGQRHAALARPSGGFLAAGADHPETALVSTDAIDLVASSTLYARLAPPEQHTLHLAEALGQGPAALDGIDGDYALAAVSRDGTLTLARDFFGCAPLYFAHTPSGLAFASEYKALLCVDGFDPTPDPDMLQHLQHGKRLPLGKTLFSQIEAVLPGTRLAISPDGSRKLHRTPALEAPGVVTDEAEARDLIRGTLVTALTRRTADLDTIGLALSGGIDSIALAFMIHTLWPTKRLVTVCAGSSPEDHECVTARAVAKAVCSEHYEVLTPPGDVDLDTLRKLAWHLEDPYSRSETLQLSEVGRIASQQGCPVVLSAQGADGLFAGMPKYKLLRLMQKHPLLRPGLKEFWSFTQLGLPPRSAVGRLGVKAKFRNGVPGVPRVHGSSYSPEPSTFPPHGPQFINRSMARGFQAGVCQDIQKFERGFAAHGVEYRSPFYDMDFVHAAYSIDDALKLKDGQEKWILRRALDQWVPEEFLNIPKFPQRIDSNRAFADSLDRLVNEARADDHATDPFEPGEIDRLLRDDTSKPYSYEGSMRIWTVIMTLLWDSLYNTPRPEPQEMVAAHG